MLGRQGHSPHEGKDSPLEGTDAAQPVPSRGPFATSAGRPGVPGRGEASPFTWSSQRPSSVFGESDPGDPRPPRAFHGTPHDYGAATAGEVIKAEYGRAPHGYGAAPLGAEGKSLGDVEAPTPATRPALGHVGVSGEVVPGRWVGRRWVPDAQAGADAGEDSGLGAGVIEEHPSPPQPPEPSLRQGWRRDLPFRWEMGAYGTLFILGLVMRDRKSVV